MHANSHADIMNLTRPISTGHVHMTTQERAKQFAPFASLKGYGATIRYRQRELVPRTLLSDDAASALDQKLNRLRPGDIITVVYFCPDQTVCGYGSYREISGTYTGICQSEKTLLLAQQRIPIADIVRLTGESLDAEVLDTP